MNHEHPLIFYPSAYTFGLAAYYASIWDKIPPQLAIIRAIKDTYNDETIESLLETQEACHLDQIAAADFINELVWPYANEDFFTPEDNEQLSSNLR